MYFVLSKKKYKQMCMKNKLIIILMKKWKFIFHKNHNNLDQWKDNNHLNSVITYKINLVKIIKKLNIKIILLINLTI
jgi:hypothetical protein